MPRFGLVIYARLRDAPSCLTGAAVAVHGVWAGVPTLIYLPLAALLTLRLTVRLWDARRA